jgi:hypothetical protein
MTPGARSNKFDAAFARIAIDRGRIPMVQVTDITTGEVLMVELLTDIGTGWQPWIITGWRVRPPSGRRRKINSGISDIPVFHLGYLSPIALRVCPETSSWVAKFSEHQAD